MVQQQGFQTRTIERAKPESLGPFARGPQVFQKHFVAQGVHALPKTAVAIGAKFRLLRQGLHRFALPDRRIASNVINDLGFENEESTVDPAGAAVGLFPETGDDRLLVVETESPESAGGLHGGQGGKRALAAVESD